MQTINVNTPLGNTLGQICRDSQGVLAVNAKGERFTAPDVRQLSQKLLGLRTATGIPRRMDAGAVGGGLAAQLDGGRRSAAGRMEYQPPNTGRRQRQGVGFAQ